VAGLQLEEGGLPIELPRLVRKDVEQHGLADAAQPGEHHAAFRTPAGDPLQDHLELAELTIPAG
jgi:hypothetical protein